MKILGTLFGGEAKVKIMRLFLFNPELTLDTELVSHRVGEKELSVGKELVSLEKINLLSKKTFTKAIAKKIRGEEIVAHKKVGGYCLNTNFKYLSALQNLLINVSPLGPKDLMQRISKVGKLKLVIISGVFIQNQETRLDLMVVGDNLNLRQFEKNIHLIEQEIGKELRYSIFETSDFKYRMSMYDRLIRDVLDYPHEVLLDKLNISGAKSEPTNI